MSTNASAPPNYEAAIEKAIRENAFRDEQWLRLGHWKPRGFVRGLFHSDYRSEADGLDLFISPEGKTDPAAELRATLRNFATPISNLKNKDEAEHAQCLFPARRKWAFKKLGWDKILSENGVAILPCEARRAWKAQLDAEGVSLVFASAYLNNAASMFGHTFLKFHSRGNKAGRDLLDYGVNFAAETGDDGGAHFALWGLLGFYPGRFTMQPFHQTLRTYANLEGRDLIEYRLNFTPEELDFFIDHLFEVERTYFDYYFLTENCSYFLLTALEAAKPEIRLSDEFFYEVIPADSVRVVARTPGLVVDTKFRPSLMAFFRTQAKALTPDDLQFAKDVIDRNGQKGVNTDPKSASTRALDLAIDYGAVRATADPKFDDINHKLRAERASRGGASPPTIIPPPRRPEEGHDPARVGLISEIPTDPETSQARFGLQLRFAYHDRLSNDDGYLRGTTLEVMRLTAFQDEKDRARFSFRELTFLEILSAQPVDRFDQPFSWRAAFGFREPLATKSLGPYVSIGAGGTFSIGSWLWLTALADGEAIANPDIEPRTQLSIGPRLIATTFISEKLKFGFDTALMKPLFGGHQERTLKTEFAWATTRNLEIRLGYHDATVETEHIGSIKRSEWVFKLYQHLLF